MKHEARRRWSALAPLAGALLLLGLATGCGPERFTVKFQVADVINVPDDGDDSQAQMLDVDIVVLDKKDNDRLPGIRDGTVRARDWFARRDRNETNIPRERIFTLCATDKRAAHAVRKRDALTGARRMGSSEVPVEIEYRDVSGAKIAVFAAYRERTNSNDIRNNDPVMFEPGMKTKEAVVRVERTRLSR